MTFLVVDVETTGLKPEYGHAICEIAAVHFNGNEITQRFESLVNPQRQIPQESTRINGIKDADVQSAPIFADIAPQFLALTSNLPLAGYNVPFDLSFLNPALIKSGFSGLNNPAIDVCELSRKFFKGLPSYSLGNVASYFKLSFTTLHRAMVDVEATCEILKLLLFEMKKQGIKTLGEAVVLSAKR